METETETEIMEPESMDAIDGLDEAVVVPQKFTGGPGLKSNLPLLTREEEVELAVKYRETHDPAIARKLVESHLRLVVKIARDCCSRPALLPDLIQEGCLGLMRAVEKYDPDRGIRLSSYAAWWIRAYVYQYIMANTRMMRVATTFTQRKLFFNLKRERNRVESEGKDASPRELATRLGVSEEAVVEMTQRLDGREVQFETTLAVESPGASQSRNGICVLPRPDEAVEESNFQSAIRIKMKEVVATLDMRDRVILEERLMAERPITLRDLGLKFGVSRERARQLEERLKNRLKPLLQNMLGEGEGHGIS
jgi:RNA polymerase sigma-32 factor